MINDEDPSLLHYFPPDHGNLTINDAGLYRCKAGSEWSRDVRLHVANDSCCGGSVEQTAYLGGTVTLKRKCPAIHRIDPKWWMKVPNGYSQSVMSPIGDANNVGRFSLNGNSQECIFTQTHIHVSQQDEGVYLCGVRNSNFYVFFMEVHLHVKGVYWNATV
ncbi:uncharacterized protein LOC127643476 isoform X2 [Xyrauchen texanus]|uniref:uncharacterized protein LOC127643476 isoform X2 n=1 Tax=Xyrauchen texanus TaxID=154827 RepID=UPI002241947C|nr:uncharacterized protein LOC127643476 isoform X2 [Xyrauchen texanus]